MSFELCLLALKTMIFAKKFCDVSSIFKALNILKIKDIPLLELGKFVYQTFKGNFPHKIDMDSVKLASVHKHYTRHTVLPINSTYPE